MRNIIQEWLFTGARALVENGRHRVLTAEDFIDLPTQVDPHFENDWIPNSINSKTLLWSLFLVIRSDIWIPMFLEILQVSLTVVQPMIIHQFIFASSQDLQNQSLFSAALFWASLLGVFAIFRGVILQRYFFLQLKIYQRLVNFVNRSIFLQALRLTRESQIQSSVGDVVNLMSSDSDSIADLPMVVGEFATTILTIVTAVAMLGYYLGWSAVPPILLMFVLVPFTKKIAKSFSSNEEEMMKFRDRRVSMMGQVLNAIRVIKYFVWEKSIFRQISGIRDQELLARRRLAKAEVLSGLTYMATSSLILFVALFTHSWRGQPLDAALIFTCIAIFSLLDEPFGSLSWTISRWTGARVSAGRLAKFLQLQKVATGANEALSLSMDRGAKLVYSRLPQLAGKDLVIQLGESIAIIGEVGSGKSTLLLQLMGEIQKNQQESSFYDFAENRIFARTAYVPQESFMMNGSLAENIQFGLNGITQEKLLQAVQLACFSDDLTKFSSGFQTEIGEKGINLSGGQKQRVSLARAFVTDPQIIFLDDPLSAVDIETEKKLCDQLIFGAWSGVTRVMATHRLQGIDRFDRIIVMNQGQIVSMGTFAELKSTSPLFQRYLHDHQFTHHELVMSDVQSSASTMAIPERVTDDEEKEEGVIHKSIYWDYVSSLGGEGRWKGLRLFLLFSSALLMMAAPLLQRWWLGASSGQRLHYFSFLPESWAQESQRAVLFYGLLTLVGLFLTAITGIFWAERGLLSGKILHDRMLRSLLGTSTRFFDATPVGRILQRFSRDIDSIDMFLPRTFQSAISILFEVLLCLMLIVLIVPMSLIFTVPLLYLYYRLQNDYRRPAREVKRMDSLARSPRYAHFKEVLTGLVTIRGFHRTDWATETFMRHLRYSQKVFFNHYILNRWFSVRIPILGGLISVASLMSATYAIRAGYIESGIAGLLAIYMLSFWGYLNWGIRVFADIESRMTSVERLKVYSFLPPEEQENNRQLPVGWPSRGEIRFENVSARYASHLPLVLKNVSLLVPGGKKVALVGKTGSGKSTVLQVLYRFIPVEQGRILIDGLDISQIPLSDLRKNIAIIPQDPTLFRGTIRENLSRDGDFTDEQIWLALEKANLASFIRHLPKGLDHELAENAQNLSQGQRQLLCLARALLLKVKILVLDEATASVDVHTDTVIQRVIREELDNVTVLAIAHRLGTVKDYQVIHWPPL